MEVMKKFYGAVCVIFTTIIVVLLLANNVFASQTNSVINSTIKNKKFELPSKIHKDGEGFYEVGRMLTPRYRHSSVLLQDGRVFIVGGSDENDTLNTTEIFDPKTGKSTKGPDMPYPGFECTLKLLSNGNVIIVGGQYSHLNRVSVYYPKENKIIEADKRLNNIINHVAAIEEIANGEVFIADYFNPLHYYSFYNKNTNELLNVKEDQPSGKFFDAYLGRIHNNLYFLWGTNVITVNILNRNKFLNTHEIYKPNLKHSYCGTSHGFFLKDKKTLFIYKDGNDSYILFNTQTKIFQEIKPKIEFSYMCHISLLEDGNIIFISPSKKKGLINIIELDPYNGSGVIKPYTAPNLAEVSVVNLDGNDLLYTGGAKIHDDGLVTFGYYYGISDKIYLWKTKKENN